MVPYLTLTERKHKRKQLCGLEKLLLSDSEMLPVNGLCASDPEETVPPCCLKKLMTGSQTQSHWAEGMHSFLQLNCHSPSPAHWVCGPSSGKGWGRAETALLLHLKAISLAARCFEAAYLFKYQFYAHIWERNEGKEVRNVDWDLNHVKRLRGMIQTCLE